ncbi:hypothetical protein OAI07_00185 [Akkermansiaceae bacterium]|nr:hypothetical protein [Akkermansiaceae bacterium]
MSYLSENHDLNALLAFLDQAAALTELASDNQWGNRNDGFRGSTLGQHMRHTLDHVEALCTGLPKGVVNYDLRIRATNMETSTSTANSRCQFLKAELTKIGQDYTSDSKVNALSSCSNDSESHPQSSSFGRELQFVISHTVHHFAILAAICHSLDIATSADFGIAPSTLKHQETLSAK